MRAERHPSLFSLRMQKRLAPFLVTGLALGTLPFLWFACTSAQTPQSSGTAASTGSKPSGSAKVARPSEAAFHSNVQPFVQEYCVKCHGGKKPEAELDLSSTKEIAAVTADPARWNLVLQRLKDKEMPPDDAEKQPTDDQRKPVVAWLENVRAYETERMAGDPGTVLARRLSNAEYDYTIRDLTGVDLRPAREFPVDPANQEGFDNSGESLTVSPALMKKYAEAAKGIADHMVLTSRGLEFAAHPVVVETDRDKYCVLRIVDFYKRQPTDLADYFQAAWRYR